MDLSRHGFGETLDSEFTGVVEGMAGKGTQTGERGDVEDQATTVVSGLTHDFDGTHRDPHGAEEQRLHLLMHLVLGRSLGVARERVPGIVDHDVEAEVLAKVLCSGGEGSIDRIDGRHVQSKFEHVRIAVGEVRETGGITGRGYQALPRPASDQTRNLTTDA